jgi:hypothetical protein
MLYSMNNVLKNGSFKAYNSGIITAITNPHDEHTLMNSFKFKASFPSSRLLDNPQK